MRLTLTRALAASALALTATAAMAQTAPERPTRPYRGLFGGNQDDDPNRTTQRLDLTFLAEGSYDDNVAADLASVQPGQYQGSGYGAGALAVLEYYRGRADRFFAASAQSGVKRVEDRNGSGADRSYVHHAATLSGRTKLGRSTAFSVDQRVSYQPYYSLQGLPVYSAPDSGLPPVVGVDYAIESFESIHYGTHAAIDQAVGRRSNLGVGYTFNYTDFRQETEQLRDFTNHAANVSFASGFTERTEWLATYNYQRGNYGYGRLPGNGAFENHEGQFGLRHQRRLSPTRRLLLNASAGPSITSAPDGASRREYSGAAASAGFGVDLARSWGLRGDYRRSVRFLDGFNQPFSSDRATVTVSGYVTRAWSLVLNGGYDTGEVSFSGQRNYSTALAQVQSQHAVTRNIAVTGTYFFYRYNYDNSVTLPSGLPAKLDRQGVRASLVFWLPVLR